MTEGDIVLRCHDPRPWRVLHVYPDGTAYLELHCADAWTRVKRAALSELTPAPGNTPPMRTPAELMAEHAPQAPMLTGNQRPTHRWPEGMTPTRAPGNPVED